MSKTMHELASAGSWLLCTIFKILSKFSKNAFFEKIVKLPFFFCFFFFKNVNLLSVFQFVAPSCSHPHNELFENVVNEKNYLEKNAFLHFFTYSKPYFDIRYESEYHILAFKILFWHSNWIGISYFDIQNTILTFELGRKVLFWHSKSNLTFATSQNRIFRLIANVKIGRNRIFRLIANVKIGFWMSK